MSGGYPDIALTEDISPDELHAKLAELERAFEQRQAVCKGCSQRMTWAAQRKQYGRLCKIGIGKERIKLLLPRCQKCLTLAIKEPAS